MRYLYQRITKGQLVLALIIRCFANVFHRLNNLYNTLNGVGISSHAQNCIVDNLVDYPVCKVVNAVSVTLFLSGSKASVPDVGSSAL